MAFKIPTSIKSCDVAEIPVSEGVANEVAMCAAKIRAALRFCGAIRATQDRYQRGEMTRATALGHIRKLVERACANGLDRELAEALDRKDGGR